jgi:AcrR family transcriptional regulator
VNAPTPHQPVRSDGIDARHRLKSAGLRLFAEHGFQKTSVRALARAARVNVAAVSYYFGDKTGLYRALFVEPIGGPPLNPTAFAAPGLSLEQALRRFYADFLEPLKFGDEVRLLMKLHFREMADPTGAWECALETDIRPSHEAMVGLLAREFGLPRPDVDVQRLAVAIAGMAVHLFVFSDGIDTLAPELLSSPQGIDAMVDRLTDYALSMMDGERRRRASGLQQA